MPVLHFGDCKQSVGVLPDQAEPSELPAFLDIILRRSGCHYVVFLVCLLDLVPGIFISRFKLERRSTGQVPEGQVAVASNDAIVATVKLGPGFLKEDDPELASVGSAEYWCLILAWYEVIHDHFNLLSIFREANPIDSLLVHLVRDEELPDAF